MEERTDYAKCIQNNDVKKRMTRLEKIQKMDAKEMAKFIRKILDCHQLTIDDPCCMCPLESAGTCSSYGIELFLQEEDDGEW